MKRLLLYFSLFFFYFSFSFAQQHVTLNPEQMRKMQTAEFCISHFYVDSLSEEKVVEDAIAGMLKGLDPHSTYIKAKDVERSTENLNGSFEGIGVQFNMIEDTLVVIQPVSGGPSEKKGIIAGDRIVLVNDTAIAGVKMSREEIMRRLRGPKGSKVKLGIVRDGVKGVNEFVIERDKIPVHTLDAAYMATPTVGYIRLSSFGQKTHEEMMEAVEKLRGQGMKDLILDLQGNGGGYLSAAVELANEFLPADDIIVFTKGRSVPRQDYKARGNGALQQMRLVILVDSYTASAAEIVSGAIQDNDRGVIVGRRTFGKGLVQRPFDLPDGSVIRLTTAHYYSPSGRCIQKPYKMGDRKDYDDDMNARLKTGELTTDLQPLIDGANVTAVVSEATEHKQDTVMQKLQKELFPDSLCYITARKGRAVYGGGGIMPDIYVPLDTTQYTPLYRQLSAKSCILNASLKYMDKNRKTLTRRWKTFADYNANFETPQALIDALLGEAKKAKIEVKDEALAETIPLLKTQLKALLARDLWDMSEYYHIINETSHIYQRAIELFKEK